MLQHNDIYNLFNRMLSWLDDKGRAQIFVIDNVYLMASELNVQR